MAYTLDTIRIYPVKSMAGLVRQEADVTGWGLAGDRRWMVVDAEDRFITQRTCPALARIQVEERDGGVVLAAPGRLSLPVAPPATDGRLVQVWKDAVEAHDGGAPAAAWLSDYLGRAVRIVYMPETTRRPVDPRYGAPGDHVTFADGYPLLLTGTASLEALNERLDEPIPMNRFRPNVVVSGSPPFGEDTWRRIRIGAVPFRVVKPCARCVVTTVDQQTGTVTGTEPLRTLARFRRGNGKVYFGQNLIPDAEGVIRVGDPIEILESGPSNLP